MRLQCRAANRWFTVQSTKRATFDAAGDALAMGKDVQADFVMAHANVPACDDTRFVVLADDKHIVIAVTPTASTRNVDSGEAVEIFFDPRGDRVGFVQYYFPLQGEPLVRHHLPYDEIASTRTKLPTLPTYEWRSESFQDVIAQSQEQKTLFVKFAIEDVCADGRRCGFNIGRSRTVPKEITNWNLATGNGFCDASSFGSLYLKQPPKWMTVTNAKLVGKTMQMAGECSKSKQPIAVTLIDPLGKARKRTIKASKGSWQAKLTIDPKLTGRYIFKLDSDAEPTHYQIDLPAKGKTAAPSVGMFMDFPDDLRCGHYTPERFTAQFDNLKSWGVDRLWWIDIGSFSENESYRGKGLIGDHAARTYKECGEPLPTAVNQAHKAGLTAFGTFKLFDQGFRHTHSDEPASDRVLDDDNQVYCPVLRPVRESQEAVIGPHDEWFSSPEGGIAELRFISREPMGKVKASDVSLWSSSDNKRYRKVSRGYKVTVEQKRVPHTKWTPAGAVRDKGTYAATVLTISGLKLKSPYVAVRIGSASFACVNRRFALAEAIDSKGQNILTRIAYAGDEKSGFRFSPPWLGWANHTEPIHYDHTLNSNTFGLLIREPKPIRQIIEPVSPIARNAWLAQAKWMLEQGIDGIDIRIYCHHCGCDDWQMYAINEDVQNAFAKQHGREVKPTAEDMHLVEQLRGSALTTLMRDMRQLVDQYDKRLAVHLEPGIEVPQNCWHRMALPIDWQTWIAGDIAHEVMLKFWSAANPFIAEQLLPLARKHGVAVHLCDNNSGALGVRAIERCTGIAENAKAAGVGVTFYENHGFQRLNHKGITLPIGHAQHAVRAAANVMQTK